MPKYRVETDQGKYDVELDQAPSSDAELHSLVSQHLSGGGQAPTPAMPAQPPAPTGNALSRAWGTGVQAAKDYAVEPAMRAATTPLVNLTRVLNGEPLGQVASTFHYPMLPESKATPFADMAMAPVATPTQAGITAMTLGSNALRQAAAPAVAPYVAPAFNAVAQRLPWLARISAPVATRIAGGTLGGAIGGATEGAPVTGAAEGLARTALGEGIGAGLGMGRRVLPGAKSEIAGRDAAAYGAEMGRQSPPLAGARTADELRTLAAGPGREALGAAKGAANADISAGIGARAGTLEIPSLGQTTNVTQPIGQGGTHTVTVIKPMTLQEANDALSEIGAKAFSKNPLDRNFNGVDQRQLYGKVSGEIRAALDKADPTGYSSGAFDQAQQAHKAGLALLKPLERDAAYRRYPDEVQFNTPFLQKYVANPKNEAALRNKLGDEGFDSLVNILTRGGGVGTQDSLAGGQGRTLDALRQVWGKGMGGAPQILGSVLRTATPNIGSQYAGKAPLAVPNLMQMLIDLGAQKGVDTQVPR